MQEDRKLAGDTGVAAQGPAAQGTVAVTPGTAALAGSASATLGRPSYPDHANLLGVQVSYRAYVLFLLTVVYLINFVDRQIISILLPFIKDEFQVSDTWLGLLSGLAFGLFYATLGIPIARFADRHSRRTIISVSLALFSVMTVLCGLASQFWQLFLARMGVGVGEAGTSPPSHSIIADLYKPEERATAMGIFALGVPLGIMVGFFAGGQIAAAFDWRVAFVAAGLPGLFLALIVYFTLRDPPRGLADNRHHDDAEQPPLSEVVTILISRRAFVHICFGSALSAMVGYGVAQWVPSYLVRTHEMDIGTVGLVLALIFGVFGGIGTFFGGYLADKMAQRDVRWTMWLPAIGVTVSTPFALFFYLSDMVLLGILAFLVPATLSAIFLAPALSICQSLVPTAMRATTSAVFLFITNIVGLGLGPLVIGALSDLLLPAAGDASTALRWSLALVSLIGLWAALHMYLASRSLKEDLART